MVCTQYIYSWKVLDPIKMYHVKHCIEKIVEQIEDKAK